MNARNENSAASGKCPDPEVLSAYFDHEESASKDVAEHVKSCDLCRRQLDVYARIASGLKSSFSSAQAEDLSIRIKAGVHEKLKRELPKRAINFPQWISSAAAGLAVCALGAYMVTHMEKPHSECIEPQVAEASAPAPEERLAGNVASLVPSELSAAPSMKTEVAESNNMSESYGSIDLSKLSSVSFGGDEGAMMMAGAAEDGVKLPAMIEPSVRHVWMRQPGTNLTGRVKAVTSALSLDPKRVSITPEGDGSCKVSFDVTRRQSVAIVRAFKASGFELLSPQQPQPEQSVFRGSGDEPVSYEADFVLKR